MSVEWASMGGISLWAPAPGGPWSSAIDNANPANPSSIQWRLGGDSRVNQHVGKVVRGFRLQGSIGFSGNSAMVLDALRGIAQTSLPLNIPAQSVLERSPVPAGRSAAERYNFNWEVARTMLPIGFLTPETEWWNAAGPAFGGVGSTQAIQLDPNPAGGGRIMRADSGVVQILVSDRPVAQIDVLPQMQVGQSVPVTGRLRYPGFEDDPISGVAVSLSASPGTQVSLNQLGPFGPIATLATNASGYVYFWVKAVAGGEGQLVMDLAGDAPVVDTLRSTVGFVQNNVPSQVSRSTDYIRQLFTPALPLRAPMKVYADPAPPNPGQCVTYPTIPPVPGIPARLEVADDYGWNSGANSLDEVEGDFELRFDEMEGGAIGAVIGVMPAIRENQGDYTRVTHGFYFTKTASGSNQVSIIESGRVVFGPIPYSPAAIFSLQRVGAAVLYLIDGVPRHTSARPLAGTAMAATSLYATTDAVPSTNAIGDCFWTDIQFASQQCGGGSTDLEPNRTYTCNVENGGASVEYEVIPRFYGFGGIIYEGSQAKLIVCPPQNYFPDEVTDYLVADIIISRLPRVSSGFTLPEFVANVSAQIPCVFVSSNGNIPNKFYGDISGLPEFEDPYVYYLEISFTVYNENDEVITSDFVEASVFIDSAEGATADSSLTVTPIGGDLDPFDVDLLGVSIHEIQGENEILLYCGGYWRGIMGTFTCDDFMASVDGQPAIEIHPLCS